MKLASPLAAIRAGKASRNVERLISCAKKEMLIVCGGLNPSVYETKAVVSATRAAVARHVTFRIIVGPDFDKKRNTEFVKLTRSGIKVASKRPPVHFAVCDNQHIRFEGWHEQGSTIPLNNVLWGRPDAAEKLVKLYNKMLSVAKEEGVEIVPLSDEG